MKCLVEEQVFTITDSLKHLNAVSFKGVYLNSNTATIAI